MLTSNGTQIYKNPNGTEGTSSSHHITDVLTFGDVSEYSIFASKSPRFGTIGAHFVAVSWFGILYNWTLKGHDSSCGGIENVDIGFGRRDGSSPLRSWLFRDTSSLTMLSQRAVGGHGTRKC